MKNICSSLAETKIDSTCPQRSPDSSCSSSSANEWDTNSHNLTVRRLPPLPPLSRKPPPPPFYNQLIDELNKLPQRPPPHLAISCLGMKHYDAKSVATNDKLSAFMETAIGNSPRLLYFSPEQEINSSSADCVSSVPTGIQDQLRTTQMTHLNRDLTPTISEVYHERSIGLGLAPSLTKLLLPQAEEPEPLTYDNENNEKNKAWLSPTELQRFYPADLIAECDIKARSVSPCSELSRRDEGDGRSIADSQCSAGSYKRAARQMSSTEFEENAFQKNNVSQEDNSKTKVPAKQPLQDAKTKANSSSIC